jgi:hypothetical protein
MLALATIAGMGFTLNETMKTTRYEVDPDIETTEAKSAWTPHEITLSQHKQYGYIVPQFHESAGRVPFNASQPPYSIYQPVLGGKLETVDDIYRYQANAREHERLDTAEQLAAHRPHFITRKAGPIVTTFTRELIMPFNPSLRTGIINWTFIPPNATDQDVHFAHDLVKAIVPDPELSTPDAVWWNYPDVEFRHGGRGN